MKWVICAAAFQTNVDKAADKHCTTVTSCVHVSKQLNNFAPSLQISKVHELTPATSQQQQHALNQQPLSYFC